MNLSDAFKKGIEILKNVGNEAPASDAGVLLCSAVRCDRAFLYAHGSNELDSVLLENYFSMLERRAAGMPLQYLTGVQEFMSLSFEVGEGVLVPRQETEILVEAVMNLCRERGGIDRILDIGTGSGCIAVSLAYYIPDCNVTAIDKMLDALAIAQRNAITNGVADRVRFVKSNLFEELEKEPFDVMVSNPPYIRTKDIEGLQREVRCYEPPEALDGGEDGLHFYKAILHGTQRFLREGGSLAFETGYDQAAEVAALMSGFFRDIKIYKDLAGIERVVIGVGFDMLRK